MTSHFFYGELISSGLVDFLRDRPMKRLFLFFIITSCLHADWEAKVVVIGSGPAGIAAAMHASDLLGIPTDGDQVLLVTGDEIGGLLTHASKVQNCPGIDTASGMVIMDKMVDQAKAHGVLFLEDSVISVDFTQYPFTLMTSSNGLIIARSVIIATGTSPKNLGVPGEAEYWEKGGVSACALCDAFAYQGKTVAVVGGGDSAVDQAIHLAQYADKVYVLVRSKEMRAKAFMVSLLRTQSNKIELLYNKAVLEIVGDGESVTGIRLSDKVSGQEEVLPVDGVFLAIGHKANTELFKGKLELSSSGRIIVVPETRETTVPGIFAAGDVVFNEYRQVPVAIGSAVLAAHSAVEWMRFRFIPVEER